MTTPNNIFLIGPMGAGKSTVGNQLARSLEKTFIDCDQELIKRTGASIPLIFEVEGEEGFRKREQDLLAELTEVENVVLATGGGVILRAENRARLRSRGFAIYLNASIDLLVARTSRDRSRPLLNGTDPRKKFEELLAHRDPLYRQVADLVVKTNQRTTRHVVKDIVRRLEDL